MRRRICLVVGLVALAAPASGWAQSSSQAQYQGVAPETQIPVGGPGGTAGSGGVVTGGGVDGSNGSQATGGGRPASGSGSHSSASKGTTTAAGGDRTPPVSLPSASSSTSPFGGTDIVWILLAVAGLVALGLLLRRGTGHSPSGA